MTIVLAPLLALIHDQVQKLQNFGISAAYLDSTQSKAERESVMDSLCNGEVQILYLAPERLDTGILLQIEKNNKIGMVVIDECHCVTSWGYTFRESYLMIGEYIDRLNEHPVIVALSATALPEDRPAIMKLLSMRKVETFEMSLFRGNLAFMKRTASSCKAQQVVVHPTLVLGDPDRSRLYRPERKREYQSIIKRVNQILSRVEAPCSVDDMKLYRCDVTGNWTFDTSEIVDEYIRILKKSCLLPRYSWDKFREKEHKARDYKVANRHSCKQFCKSAAFFAYDKTAQMEMIEAFPDALLRLFVSCIAKHRNANWSICSAMEKQTPPGACFFTVILVLMDGSFRQLNRKKALELLGLGVESQHSFLNVKKTNTSLLSAGGGFLYYYGSF